MTKDLNEEITTEETIDVTLVTSAPLESLLGVSLEPDEEPEYGCSYVIRRGSKNYDSVYFGPDEHCEEPVVPGEEYCAGHLDNGDSRDYEPDSYYDSNDAPQYWEP
jgi:hypothetical protein